MIRFVQGEDRRQPTMLPNRLDDYVAEENPVRVVDVFADELDLRALKFSGVVPATTGRLACLASRLSWRHATAALNEGAPPRRTDYPWPIQTRPSGIGRLD